MFNENCARDEEFLSEEDLTLAQLSPEELMALWNAWLVQVQSTNDSDAGDYSHGVFLSPERAQQF